MTTTKLTPEQAVPERSWLGVAVAAALLAVAVTAGIGTRSLGYWTSIGPGAGFFPLCLAVILGGAAITWGLGQWRGEAIDAAESTEVVQTGEETNSLRSIAAIVVSLILAALALEPLGFQITMLVFLFFHLRVLGGHDPADAGRQLRGVRPVRSAAGRSAAHLGHPTAGESRAVSNGPSQLPG